jgi:hypothetical protein
MNALVKSVRHVQIKKIAYSPDLYTALITYEPYHHPCEYDESDDIEHQKNLINKLLNKNWFVKGGKNIPDAPEYF